MRPEHRHLSMHHREPPPRTAAVTVTAPRYSHEVQEHEHELAKRNGCHGKAHYPSEAAQQALALPAMRLTAPAVRGVHSKAAATELQRRGFLAPKAAAATVGHQQRGHQLPPLRTPPRKPRSLSP